MAYDSRIILAGQGPDILGAVNAGDTAAATTNALRTNNRLAELYRTQGAGILSGDQNALNALAGIDPNAALGIQGTQLGMEATRLNMSMAQEEMQMKRDAIRAEAERAAAAMTAEQRAAEAAKIESGIKAASTAQTPEQWDAIVTQFGVPDLAGQFGMKDALLTQYAEVADILKGGQGDLPANVQELEWRAKQAGLIPGTPEYQAFILNGGPPKPQSGMRITSSPDGGFTLEEGAGVTGGAPLKENQAKLVLFQSEMDQARAALSELETKFDPANFADFAAGAILGDTWGNALKSEEGQLYKSAGLQWIDAGLRIATGAAATEAEVQRRWNSYFPLPGDSPAVIEYKRRSRENFQRSVDQALQGVRPETAPGAPADPFVSGGQQPQGAAPATTPAQDGWTDLGGGVLIREVP